MTINQFALYVRANGTSTTRQVAEHFSISMEEAYRALKEAAQEYIIKKHYTVLPTEKGKKYGTICFTWSWINEP